MDAATTTQAHPARHAEASASALGPLLGLAGLVGLILIASAGGYGYHRDELYFLAAGEHLAWSYPDQGPLTPVAHVMNVIAPGSLTALRIPSALMAAATVMLTGIIAAELGGRRRAQLIAAACAASPRSSSSSAICSARPPSTCSPGRSSAGWSCGR